MSPPAAGHEAQTFPLADTINSAVLTEDTLHAGAARVATAAASVQMGAARYELGQIIGQGGMGRVLEAKDRQFGRVVAVKELHAAAENPGLAHRFLIESIVTANLEHPGIPPVYERGLRDGAPFYTMRRLEGQTLSEALARVETLKDRLKLLPLLVQVVNTIGFAHERGVVHRDLKPDNVIVGHHGEAVVLDWGIAKVRGVASDAGIARSPADQIDLKSVAGGAQTVTGSVLGTPAYMAPEQANGKVEEIDERTDVFALGALLYHLLVGHAPYRGPNASATLIDALQGKRPPLRSVASAAPAALRAICDKAMALAPADRFASAAELAEALEGFAVNAVVGEESRIGRITASAIGWFVAVIIAVNAAAIWAFTPTLKEQGIGVLFCFLLAAFGLAASALEWRTHGRYTLSSLSVAAAGATVLLGLAFTTIGMGAVFSALKKPEFMGDPDRYRALFTQGAYEAIGNIATCAGLGAVQLVVWGLMVRAVSRARADRIATPAS